MEKMRTELRKTDRNPIQKTPTPKAVSPPRPPASKGRSINEPTNILQFPKRTKGKLSITMEENLYDIVAKSAMQEGISFSEWVERAIRVKLPHMMRVMGYAITKP